MLYWDVLLWALLIVGCLFPVLSLITVWANLYYQRVEKRYVSAILMPLISPVSLDVYQWIDGRVHAHAISGWLLLLPWVLDLGTVNFFLILPRLIREWWSTSSFTRLQLFTGKIRNQSAVLSLHQNGVYLLQRTWRREPGQSGVGSSGETGRFVKLDNGIRLQSSYGHERVLKLCAAVYTVEELKPVPLDYSLSDCVFTEQSC